MKLKKLLHSIPFRDVKGSKEVEITQITSDSRIVSPGALFIARRGGQTDGSLYIAQAIESGAVAVVSEFYNPFLGKITQLIHPHPAECEAALAKTFYHHPSKELFVVGTTGTKGKTTTSYLLQHLLADCGLISTVETIVGRRRVHSTLTTHDVIRNHKVLREMVDEGCKAAALEVSSHGLAQGRVDGIEFDAALFTNLHPDHLDYHKTMEEYAKAKSGLFARLAASGKPNRCAVANADDPWTPVVCPRPDVLFGLGPKADVRAEAISLSAAGTTFTVQGQLFRTPLIGTFNVYNLLGAIALGLHRGLDLPTLASRLATFHTVPGRLERVPSRRRAVFVDYAHMEEALDNVLKTLRPLTQGRLFVVFGAGGNRDPGRRPGLARAAERGADVAIVTTDNPRHEDPQEICRQILAGFSRPEKALVELDRKKAIGLALQLAEKDDIVLIAGKGHERVQIFAHQTVPFDDKAVAQEHLDGAV